MGALQMSTTDASRSWPDSTLGVLAVERADGPPLVTPVWYRYQPGGVVELSTDAASVKGSLLATAERATLCAQREELLYVDVTVEGPVTFGEASDDARLDIATRVVDGVPALGCAIHEAWEDNAATQLGV